MIYLDNGATTKVNQNILNKILPYLKDQYANPSSSYGFAFKTKNVIDEARKDISNILHCKENEIYFTSCGSESDNWALKGICFNKIIKGDVIMSKQKILHLFLWDFRNIINNMDNIKNSGFDAIQIMPIQPHKYVRSNTYDEYYKNWWIFYQPLDITIENKDEFIEMCKVAHEHQVKVYVDVVLRHVASDDINCLSPNNCVSNRLLKYLDKPINCVDYNNREQEISRCTGLPMLDYENIELQNIYIEFLNEVLEYADGIRFDQMKHYRLPSEGGSFFDNVISKLPKDKFYYGECINCKDEYKREYEKYVLPLVMDYEANNKCVVMPESHDSTLSFMYTLYMTNDVRLSKWEDVVRQYDNCLYFARRDDSTIFSNRMREINMKYR